MTGHLFDADRFDADWLSLRAPADEAARSSDLTGRFGEALLRRGGGAVRIVDLGSGTGANFRFLAPRLAALGASAQSWRLVDRDENLLERVAPICMSWAGARGWGVTETGGGLAIAAEGWRAKIRCVAADLSAGLDGLPLAPDEAVVTTALLDLVSASWLASLVRRIASRGAPLLATITDDGALAFRPPEPEDALVRGLFAAHQRRDKGFGPALGPAATAMLARMSREAGYLVEVRRSPWLLPERGSSATTAAPTAGARLLSSTLAGIAAAAADQDPERAGAVAAWLSRRAEQLSAGRLRMAVGHRDLLALPPDQPSSQLRMRR